MLRLEIKEMNGETGELLTAGFLNRKEMNFLIQFAINTLMSQGVIFNLKQQLEEGDDETMRITIPDGVTVQ